MKKNNRKAIRIREDADGPCFALTVDGTGCKVMSAISSSCGTYECPFYKPRMYRTWARIEKDEVIWLIPMEPDEMAAGNIR